MKDGVWGFFILYWTSYVLPPLVKMNLFCELMCWCSTFFYSFIIVIYLIEVLELVYIPFVAITISVKFYCSCPKIWSSLVTLGWPTGWTDCASCSHSRNPMQKCRLWEEWCCKFLNFLVQMWERKENELNQTLDLDIERKDRSMEELAAEADEFRKLFL